MAVMVVDGSVVEVLEVRRGWPWGPSASAAGALMEAEGR